MEGGRTRITEAQSAMQLYPYLKQQLITFSSYKKQIDRRNTPLHAYVSDIIGTTELQLALAQAILANARDDLKPRDG